MAQKKKKKVVQVHVAPPRRPPTLLEYRGHRANLISKNLGTLIRSAAVVALGWFGYLSIDVLAGEETVANIVVKVLGDLRVSEWAAYLFGGAAITYGWRQKGLLHKVNETQGARVSQLEQEIDRRRTSSRLTKRGQTDPKDTL